MSIGTIWFSLMVIIGKLTMFYLVLLLLALLVSRSYAHLKNQRWSIPTMLRPLVLAVFASIEFGLRFIDVSEAVNAIEEDWREDFCGCLYPVCALFLMLIAIYWILAALWPLLLILSLCFSGKRCFEMKREYDAILEQLIDSSHVDHIRKLQLPKFFSKQ